MYGPAGERRLTEWEVPWLSGYQASKPVRVGNAASEQFQLDVYGEVIDALYESRRGAIVDRDMHALDLILALLDFLEDAWKRPDEGIWEVRGPRQHFTHSKVMAWVAFDRAVKILERRGSTGKTTNRWRHLRDRIHADVCRKAFDSELGSFVQAYGSKALDASLLLLPLVGFLPPTDPRIIGTVAAIERRLVFDGFVCRYDT